MTSESSTHFIVQVKIKAERPRKLPAGLQLLPARWEWLSVEDTYITHTSIKNHAKRFDRKPWPDEIARWDGYPHSSRHDGRFKPRIFKVIETRTEEEL